MRRLIAIALTCALVLAAYRIAPDTTGWDAALLLYTAAGLLLLVAIMATYTRHWTVLGAGLLGIFLGAALLRAAQASLYYHWLWMGAGDLRWVADVVRALLATGTTWAVLGALGYVRRGQEPIDPDRLTEDGGP